MEEGTVNDKGMFVTEWFSLGETGKILAPLHAWSRSHR